MRKLIIIIAFLLSVKAFSQTAALPVYDCVQHGVQASTSGLKSSNYMQGIVPFCSVTVYLTGTTTIATTTPQSPFRANKDGSITPIYAAVNQGYDVVLSGGISPNTYSSPVTLTGVYPATNFSGAGCGISGPCTIPQGGTGSNTASGALANLGAVGWLTYSGTSIPSATCSALVNNGYIAINAAPTAYQCSNATGTYQWNALGGSGGGLPAGCSSPGTGSITCTGAVTAAAVNAVYNAAAYSGGDCGAKINNADTQLLGVPAEIDVNQACGMNWTTPVVLTAGHNLKWTQGGTYTLPYGNEVLGNNVVDFGTAEIQLAAETTAPPNGTAMWVTNNGTTVANNVTFQNGNLDGNYPNIYKTTYSAHSTAGIGIQGTTTTAAHDITIKNVNFTNWWGIPLFLMCPATGSCTLAPNGTYNIFVKGNTFNYTGGTAMYSYSFDHNWQVTDNLFESWGEQGTYADAFGAANNDAIGGGTQKNFNVSNNTFVNTVLPSGGAFQYIAELDPTGGYFTNFTFDHNKVYGGPRYSELSLAAVQSSISNNIWNNAGPSELSISNSVVANNAITNGQITVQAMPAADSLNSTGNVAIGNTITNSGVNLKGIILGALPSSTQSHAIVTGNSIDITGSTGDCDGILLGPYDGNGQLFDITISNNVVVGGGAPCPGIRLNTAASPASYGIEIRHNQIDNFAQGIYESTANSSATDITVADNKILNTPTPISFALVGATIRQWGNITSGTQTEQLLANGAEIDSTGMGVFPGGLSPTSLISPPPTNLVAWYNAASVCTTAGTLANWPDASGGGNTLSGGTTNASCVLNAVNGQPAVQFTGVESGYQGALNIHSTGTTTIIAFQKAIGSPSYAYTLFDDASSTCYYCMLFLSSTNLRVQTGGIGFNTTLADTGTWHVAAYSLTSAGVGTFYVDGVQLATGTQIAYVPAGFTLGAMAGRNNAFKGEIAEGLIYSTPLSLAQIQSVGTYLGYKYGLSQAGAWTLVNGVGRLVSAYLGGNPVVACPAGGTGTQYCSASGAWTTPAAAIPVRAGTWSISSATSIAVTFATPMSAAPTSCSVPPSSSSAATGQPFPTAFATTGFTVNVPTAPTGSLSGTYSCTVNNAN